MKRFRFRLQAALDQRYRHEDQLKMELAQIRMRQQKEAARMEELLKARELGMKRAQELRAGRFQPEESHARERYLMMLAEKIAAQQEILDIVQGELEHKIEEVVQARQETRVLEKLRERQAEEHRQEELREEQRFLDELASIRAARERSKAA